MRLKTAPFLLQQEQWPRAGRHILAQFDETGVVVYQAYRPAIGRFAAEHGRFGGGFSFSRMSWVKPNFLWMMYRCGWAEKENQETVLAVTLRREAFDAVLAQAVPSTFVPELYATRDEWQEAVAASDVRLQWDPDHGPTGVPLERRAIQLGLRGAVLEQYAGPWILGIEDVTPFVREQRENAKPACYDRLLTPAEAVYPLPPALTRRLGATAATNEEP